MSITLPIAMQAPIFTPALATTTLTWSLIPCQCLYHHRAVEWGLLCLNFLNCWDIWDVIEGGKGCRMGGGDRPRRVNIQRAGLE